MRKIKKGDSVVVIAGRDKGKRGDVKATVGPTHVLVAGINQVKKHTRPNPMQNQPGGIIDKKILDNAVGDMTKLAGQKPVITKAKKSIAIWKIRTGYPLGCMVTLRQDRMYEFLDRLVSIALPRVRDFRGVSARSFDGRGNFNMGVKEQIIFPEIEYDKIDAIRGMNITIATTAKTDAEAKALLAAFKFPFKN